MTPNAIYSPQRSPLPLRAPGIALSQTFEQGRQAHEGLGFSASVTPYRSRSAFASSVRPRASSVSAMTRALSLVQAWLSPYAASWVVSAACAMIKPSEAR